MRVHLIPSTGDPLPVLHLAELPRIGDTLSFAVTRDAAWRVTRVHWPMTLAGSCEAVELHLSRVGYEL